jgi:hypothetical protein
MAWTTETKPVPGGRGIEWCAGQIDSPVRRLRFLKEYGPGREEILRSNARSSWLLAVVPVVLLVSTLPPRARSTDAGKVTAPPVAAAPEPAPVVAEAPGDVWLVERTGDHEAYSNGLRIDNRFSVANHPRSYLVFPAAQSEERGERRSAPAGIVFHTTESQLVPFKSGENDRLQRIGESLLEYVRRRRSYNFVIDRFGRVYRLVAEEDAANHAGNSVWSDADYLYLNLNESFIGVAFETQTKTARDEAEVTAAQVQSAAMLTNMLRERYGIPAGNCVTHAQVSVNTSNLQIGYHLDWASSFPFGRLGLPDNYAVPLPAVAVFGFEYDPGFARRAGDRMYREAILGDGQIRARAAEAHVEVSVYRRGLQQRYRRELAALRGGTDAREHTD